MFISCYFVSSEFVLNFILKNAEKLCMDFYKGKLIWLIQGDRTYPTQFWKVQQYPYEMTAISINALIMSNLIQDFTLNSLSVKCSYILQQIRLC